MAARRPDSNLSFQGDWPALMRTNVLLKFISQCSHRSMSSNLDAVSNGHGYVARVEQ